MFKENRNKILVVNVKFNDQSWRQIWASSALAFNVSYFHELFQSAVRGEK